MVQSVTWNPVAYALVFCWLGLIACSLTVLYFQIIMAIK